MKFTLTIGRENKNNEYLTMVYGMDRERESQELKTGGTDKRTPTSSIERVKNDCGTKGPFSLLKQFLKMLQHFL